MQSWSRRADEIQKELNGGNLKERGFQIVPAQEGIYNPQSSQTRDEVLDILSSLQNRARESLGKRAPKSLRDSILNAIELANNFFSQELSRKVVMKALKALSDDLNGAISLRKELDEENKQLLATLTSDRERIKREKAYAKAQKLYRDISGNRNTTGIYATKVIIKAADLKKIPALSDQEIAKIIQNHNLLLVKLDRNPGTLVSENQEQVERYEQHRIFRFLVQSPVAKKSFPVLVNNIKQELKRVNGKIYPTDLKRIIGDYIQLARGEVLKDV